MYSKDYIFDPQALYNLLVHYTDGEVPLNGIVREMLVNQYLARKIGLAVESTEWKEFTPLILGYDGKRSMSWTKGNAEPQWSEKNETPKKQA